MVSTFLWMINFVVGLFFGISTSEISPLNKAMAISFAAHFTILLRHPFVSAFSFRANAESRKLDLKEERERRRTLVIEEAKKERALRMRQQISLEIMHDNQMESNVQIQEAQSV